MDNSNLIGPLPSTAGTVLAKNLKSLLPSGSPNFFVNAWMGLRTAPQGVGLVFFVIPPSLFLSLAIGAFPFWTLPGLILFALWARLEFSAWTFWYPSIRAWARFEKKTDPIPDYAEAVKMIQESPNEMERRSIFLGTVAGTNCPVLAPVKAVMENVHITGPVGSYKSWMALLGIIDQMIAMHEFATFYCCLKGDVGAMHFLHDRAVRNGLPFHLVTMDPELPSEVFNPMKQSCFPRPSDKAAMVLQCLGLNSASTIHGEGFWQSMNAVRAKRQLMAFPDCNSFRELDQAAGALSKTDLAKKMRYSVHELELGAHFASEISLLADYPCLNAVGPELDIMTLIQRPCVCVFLLPANVNKAVAAKIRRFLLFTVNASARRLGPNHAPIVFATDECHEALDSTEAPIFKSCRELKITQINAHQDLQDLMMNSDKNILPMVTGNSRVSIHLGVRDVVGRKILKETGGEAASWLRTMSEDGRVTNREVMDSRITSDDFDYVNNTPGAAIVTIHEPADFAVFQHPFICQLLGFPCSHEEYEAYRRMSWPRVGGGVTAEDLHAIETEEGAEEPSPTEKGAAVLAALAAMRSAHAKN